MDGQCDGKEEEPAPEEEGEYLYLPGISPAVNGQWAYDHKITIYDKTAQKYAGVMVMSLLNGEITQCVWLVLGRVNCTP